MDTGIHIVMCQLNIWEQWYLWNCEVVIGKFVTSEIRLPRECCYYWAFSFDVYTDQNPR